MVAIPIIAFAQAKGLVALLTKSHEPPSTLIETLIDPLKEPYSWGDGEALPEALEPLGGVPIGDLARAPGIHQER